MAGMNEGRNEFVFSLLVQNSGKTISPQLSLQSTLLLLVTKDAKEFAEKMDDSELVISDVEVDDIDDHASHLTNCRADESKPMDYNPPLRRNDLKFSSRERPRTKDAREAKDNAHDRPILRTQDSASPESFNGQLFTTGLTSLWKFLCFLT